MNFEIEYIEKLANLIDEKSLSEIILPVAIVPQTPQVQSAKEETVQENTSSSKGTPITSPMVGAFYAAPSPGAKPFVKVGDIVSAGQVVCIVEAMKLMNEIESEVSGKVTQICVEDGQSVEYGQVLMYIE